MSWDITLVDKTDECVKVASHEEGGTFVVGGTERAELNITYNYGARYREALDTEQNDILHVILDGKTGNETLITLAKIITALGIDRSNDYWEPTSGNAGYAALILFLWAAQYPDATWAVT